MVDSFSNEADDNDSLNHIVLSAEMITRLYARSLVQPEPAAGSEVVPGEAAAQGRHVKSGDDAIMHAERGAARPVKFLGSNEKKVLLLVINPDVAFLPEEQLILVTKMLKACDLNLGDVAIVNLAGGQEFSELLPVLQPQKLISFGALEPAPVPPFPVITKDGMEWLMAPALGSLLQETGRNAPLKAGLWQAMQQLFDIGEKKSPEA